MIDIFYFYFLKVQTLLYMYQFYTLYVSINYLAQNHFAIDCCNRLSGCSYKVTNYIKIWKYYTQIRNWQLIKFIKLKLLRFYEFRILNTNFKNAICKSILLLSIHKIDFNTLKIMYLYCLADIQFLVLTIFFLSVGLVWNSERWIWATKNEWSLPIWAFIFWQLCSWGEQILNCNTKCVSNEC